MMFGLYTNDMRTEEIYAIGFMDIQSGNPKELRVGQTRGVLSITEKPAYGEGDKWFYDIVFDDGHTLRIFNPDTIRFKTPT